MRGYQILVVQVVVIKVSRHDLPNEVHIRAATAQGGWMDQMEGLIEQQETVAAFAVKQDRLCHNGHTWQCHWQVVKV